MLPPRGRIARYELERELGAGGMGSVYLARDPELARPVAIKLIQAQMDSPDLRERFMREARAVASLSHPHIVTVHDFGYFESRPFLVFEYVQGRSIGNLIAERELIDLETRIGWLEQLADGLEFAHRSGIVHRDIKPPNLMIDHLDRLKILDFGIARIAGVAQTMVSGLIGTPAYMAPEYVRGEPFDHRIDLFSAGAVAYELLTGRKAFPGSTAVAVMHRVLESEPAPLNLALDVPAVAERLQQVVTRALHKRIDLRYQSAKDLRLDLRDIRNVLAADDRARTIAWPAVRAVDERTPPTPPVTPARRVLDAEAVKRRRDDLIRTALARAEQALGEDRLDDAMAACLEAAAVDEARPEIIELTARVRHAIDRRQAATLILAARAALERGDLTDAADGIAAARAVSGDLTEAEALDIDIRRLRQERDTARQRATQIEALVAGVREALTAGDLAQARATLDAALRLDADHAELAVLDATLLQRERTRAEEQERRAREDTAVVDPAVETMPIEPAIARVSGGAAMLADVTIARTHEADASAADRTLAIGHSASIPNPPEASAAHPASGTTHHVSAAGAASAATSRGRWRLAAWLATGAAAVTVVGFLIYQPSQSNSPPAVAAEPTGAPVTLIQEPAGPPATAEPTVARDNAAPEQSTPAVPTAPETGVLVVDATPWAVVESIVDQRGRSSAPGGLQTPARFALPPGDYRILVRNDVLKSQQTVTARVTSGRTETVRAEFARIGAENYFDRVLRR
jgi:hypothetical protein